MPLYLCVQYSCIIFIILDRTIIHSSIIGASCLLCHLAKQLLVAFRMSVTVSSRGTMDRLGFDVSYTILSFLWIKDILALATANRRMRETCHSTAVLHNMVCMVLFRTSRLVSTLNLMDNNSTELLQFLSCLSAYPYGWDRIVVQDLNHVHFFVPEEWTGSKPSAAVALLADATRLVAAVNSLNGESTDVVGYTGRILGGDRCVLASDAFPYCSKPDSTPLCFTRIAWRRKGEGFDPVATLVLSQVSYFEVSILPIVASPEPQSQNSPCVAIGLCRAEFQPVHHGRVCWRSVCIRGHCWLWHFACTTGC